MASGAAAKLEKRINKEKISLKNVLIQLKIAKRIKLRPKENETI